MSKSKDVDVDPFAQFAAPGNESPKNDESDPFAAFAFGKKSSSSDSTASKTKEKSSKTAPGPKAGTSTSSSSSLLDSLNNLGQGGILDNTELDLNDSADSDPVAEDMECRNKARALLGAIPAARRMSKQREERED